MRKQDRVRQEQNPSEPKPATKEEAQPKQQEQVKGGTSGNQPPRPQREPGKLPLPD
jgi:hypothetical protein